MSPSCSSLYLIPLQSSRARRQGTAPITLVPSGPDTSLPSSGLVSSICRGSPPPELLVTSMAAPGRGPRARSRLAWGRAGGAPAEGPHPPTAGKVGGRGLGGAPRGRTGARGGGRVRAGRFLGCFLLAAGAHAGANGVGDCGEGGGRSRGAERIGSSGGGGGAGDGGRGRVSASRGRAVRCVCPRPSASVCCGRGPRRLPGRLREAGARDWSPRGHVPAL